MNGTWAQLAGNLALVGLAISIWAHALVWFRRKLVGYEKFLLGLLAAGAGIGSLLLTVQINPGTYVDLRYAAVMIAALFGGPAAATIAASSIAVLFLWLGGTVHGASMIMAVAGVGMAANVLVRGRSPRLLDIVLTSAAVGAALVISKFLLIANLDELASVNLPAAVLNCVATVVYGFIILKTEQSQLERSILIATFSQAPDYLYVKDRDSRFVTVNENMVRLHRRATTDEMVGLSDFDTMPRSRAEELYYHEQLLMRTGTPLVDSLEQMEDRCFLASKVPVRNAEGSVIGLAGVTRDITERTALERELRKSKDLLAHAMNGMSDGFAMFDGQGFLLFCNEQYRNAFPLSADARVVGANIRDILRRIVEPGNARTYHTMRPRTGLRPPALPCTAIRTKRSHSRMETGAA